MEGESEGRRRKSEGRREEEEGVRERVREGLG